MIGALVAGITGSGGASLSSYESIATVTGNGSTAYVEFTSIPSTFKHLQIRGIARDTLGGTGYDAYSVRFNSDTGSNYANHRLTGNGTAAGAGGSATQSNIQVYYSTVLDGNTAGIMSVTLMDILDYGSTSKYKTIRYLSGNDRNGSGELAVGSGLWQSTSAISTIRFTIGGTAFTTASTFALYGIKEA